MKLKFSVMSAMLCALTCVATAFIKIPLAVTGYVHLGDVFVFLSCVFLPLPYAVISAGVGSAFADIVSGYALYAPITLASKCLMAMLFSLCFSRGKNFGNILGAAAATAGMAFVYFLYELFLYGFAVSVANVPFNLMQGGACAAVALPTAYSMRKYWYKKKSGAAPKTRRSEKAFDRKI